MTIKKLYFISLLSASLLISCKGNSQKSISLTENISGKIDSLIASEEKQGFHGLVHIEQDGKQILYKGYGYANEETKLKFSPATFIQIGSGVKDFTKAAVYQLIENGNLKQEDPLSKVISGLAGNKLNITVKHLLEHKAGFPLGEKSDGDTFTTAELIETIQNITLKSEPGTKEFYSNLGYSCLAYIVEKVSGKSFDNYVYDHILKPIGLTNTGTYIPGFDRTKVAHGYGRDGKDIGIILDMPHDDNGHLWSLRGNGGYLSTPEEISKFFHALEGNLILKSEDFRKQIFNPADPTMLAGSDMVSFFLISNMPALKTRIIIATNHAHYEGPKLLRKIEGILFGNRIRQSDGKNMKPEIQIDLGNGEEELEKNYAGPLLDRLPVDGAGNTIQKYIDAFNSGDAEKMRKFFEDYAKKSETALPIEKRIANYKTFYKDMGKLTLSNVNASQSSEGIWEVNLITSNGESGLFIFRIEPQSPWKFEGLQIRMGN